MQAARCEASPIKESASCWSSPRMAGQGVRRAARPWRAKDELANAARILGVARTESLLLPDTGKYVERPPACAADCCRGARAFGDATWWWRGSFRVIRTERPQIVWGFDASRDPDYALHRAPPRLGEATALAFRLAADPFVYQSKARGRGRSRAAGDRTVQRNRAERIEVPVDMPVSSKQCGPMRRSSTRRLLACPC